MMISARFLVLQVVLAALLAGAWWMGWPQLLYAGDRTYLTAVIAVLAFSGIIAAGARQWRIVEFLIRGLPRYGLFGTVVGLVIVTRNSGGDFAAILGGLSTAFFTTIAGLVGAEWLRITRHLS